MPPAHPSASPDQHDTLGAQQSVGYLMKRVVLSIAGQVDRRLGPHGLTSAQWGPLMHLRRAGGATVVELARWQNLDAGAMTRLLDRLERKGLCRRRRSESDRRVVNVELTPAGADAIERVPEILSAVQSAHLAGFSEDERIVLRSLLERMLANGDAMREGSV
ncbi:MAG: MarR family transcriptional regulator [Burkholderiales bacterium]|nr:MarR family transcriptional regulator [Pseudomonadota bacterium]MCC7066843.1 MarR family transcriptional regulator [Burkholderiales bacterium]